MNNRFSTIDPNFTTMNTHCSSINPPTIKRGRGHPSGYGYVARLPSTSRHNRPSQTQTQNQNASQNLNLNFNQNQNQNANKISAKCKSKCSSLINEEGATLSTQRIYKKINNRFIAEMLTPNDLRFQSNVTLDNYVQIISNILYNMKYGNGNGLNKLNKSKSKSKIRLLAHSRNIFKLVQCVEILKRDFNGLHQLTELTWISIIDEHIPLRKGFKTTRIESATSQVEISLSFQNIFDTKHMGYQPPIILIDANEVKQVFNKTINDLQCEINTLKNQIKILSSQNENENENENQNQNQINTCNSSDENEYEKCEECENWKSKDVANFIINFDKIKYEKYYELLLEGLIREGIDGSCLKYIEKNDLLRLGILHFKDRSVIYKKIKKFVTVNMHNNYT